MLNAIACVDENWAIGKDGDLLLKIPEDMKRFKQLTKGNIVVMGRKTYQSIGHALPDRYNVVFSRDPKFEPDDCIIVESYEDMMDKLEKLFREKLDTMNIFVIGGAKIYKMLLDHIDYFLITRIHTIFEDADSFMVNLDEIEDAFHECTFSNFKSYKGFKYNFETYRR